jgi:hypothetical protein
MRSCGGAEGEVGGGDETTGGVMLRVAVGALMIDGIAMAASAKFLDALMAGVTSRSIRHCSEPAEACSPGASPSVCAQWVMADGRGRDRHGQHEQSEPMHHRQHQV